MADISSVTVTPVTGTKTIYGNKRIQISDLTIGDDSSTWPAGGVSLYASSFGMQSIDYMAIESRTLNYVYDVTTSVVNAYTGDTTGGPAKLMIEAACAVPASTEIVRAFVIGSGVR